MGNTFNSLVSMQGGFFKDSMNFIMLGKYMINFFLAVSMKKLMQSIKVLQLVSFFYLIQINFTPVSKLFLGKLYEFSTFKVLPPELVEFILYKLGHKSRDFADPVQ